MRRPGATRASLLLAVVVALALGWAFRAPLGRATLAALIDVATGGRASFDMVAVDAHEATFGGVRFEYAGVAVLSTRKARIDYDLRDLLPGGARRLGLRAIDLDGPEIVLVRRADGSFALPGGPAAGGSAAGGASGPGAPYRFEVTVRRGRIALLDAARKLPGSRRFDVSDVEATARIDSSARTHYRVRGLLANDPAQALSLSGSVDAPRGFAQHRLRARALSLTDLVNYFINTPTAAFERAPMRDVDIRAYAFGRTAAGLGTYHVAGSAWLADGAMHVPGLVPSATGMRGRIDLDDDGIAAPLLAVRLGPARIRLTGGVYAWSAPQLRLGLRAAGDLDGLRSLFRFSSALPLRGDARLATFLEGPVGTPLVATLASAARIRYGAFPVEEVAGRAIYYAQAVTVAGVSGRYGGLDVSVNGAVDVGLAAQTQLVLAASGGTGGIPYLAQAAPDVALSGQALLTGDGRRFEIRGAAGGAGGGTVVSGLFHVDPYGDGALGPLAVVRDDGASLAGTFYLRRSENESGFWLAGDDFPLREFVTPPRLPGLALVAPAFHGRVSGALVGNGPPSRFRVAGCLEAQDLQVGTLAVTAASSAVAGSLGSVRLAGVTAHGPWGAFAGRGAYAQQRLALEGTYAGDFRKIATLTGDLGARGPVAGDVAFLIDPRRTVVQVRRATTGGSRIRGLALERLSGTLSVEKNALAVYGATAALAGGTAAAAGSLAPGRPIAFSVSGVDGVGAVGARGLVPGRLSAVGAVTLRAGKPEFVGGVAIEGARYDGIPLRGNGEVAFDAANLHIARADAIAGPAVGTFSGTLLRPGTARQSYTLDVLVPATELEPVARAVLPQVPYLVGTLGASVRVIGRGSQIALAGSLSAPEGSVNGLGFEGFETRVRVDPGGSTASDGRVTVGSSRSRFRASLRGPEASLLLDAPHADLTDFNDFFDTGDTLGGTGRVRARFEQHRGAVAASADVAIAGLHYRRFDLGNATALVTSNGARVREHFTFGGASGTLDTSGTLVLARAPLPEMLSRSRIAGTARLAGLDLGVWLPALGYQLPIAGRVDADATIAGALGNPDVATVATLGQGSIGPLSIDRLVLRASSNLRRTTVEQADIALPSLDASLRGSFGFGERDPVALAVHARTSNIGELASRFSLEGLAASGTAEADVKVSGSRTLPQVTGGFDVEQAVVHGVSVPQALGEFSLHGRDVVLSGAEVNFVTGSLALAGSVPLQIEPFGFGPSAAPIALEAAANGIDLHAFTPLLPAGSALAGRIDGRVGIGGTAGSPRLSGGLTLAGGSVRTPFETVPFDNFDARLAFAGNEVSLERLRASAGSGTLAVTGSANVSNFVHPGVDATYAFSARARHLALNFPAYGSGQIDGALRFSRAAGALPLLGGNVTLSDATIPFSALLGAGGGASGTAGTPGTAARAAGGRNVGFDLTLAADRNVRVRSANVDIGARGSLHAGGTYAAPVLAGGFTSTGGTLSYFNTVFRLLEGNVTFRPEYGIVPTLDAKAITHVIDPDPNTVRNSAGSADITLAVTGPLNALGIALSSNPTYDRQQILGLLLNAPAFGATNLFGATAQNPTYYGSTNTAQLPTSLVTSRNSSGELSVAQEAFGVANAEFTRTLLAPFETTFAGALGLSNFNLNVDYTGNVGLSARKVLGKDMNAIYDTSFGYPYRQTFGFEVKPNEFEAAQVTVFQTLGAYDLNSLTPTGYITTLNSKVRAAQPAAGSAGFSLSIQRLFP